MLNYRNLHTSRFDLYRASYAKLILRPLLQLTAQMFTSNWNTRSSSVRALSLSTSQFAHWYCLLYSKAHSKTRREQTLLMLQRCGRVQINSHVSIFKSKWYKALTENDQFLWRKDTTEIFCLDKNSCELTLVYLWPGFITDTFVNILLSVK